MDAEIPERVSWRVVDAWAAIPPCNGTHPYCHVQCPYFYECYPEDCDDVDEPWDMYEPTNQ